MQPESNTCEWGAHTAFAEVHKRQGGLSPSLFCHYQPRSNMSIFISPIAFHSHGSQSIIRNTYFNVSIKCYYKTILCLCNYVFNSGVAMTTESIFKSTKTTETSTAQLIYPNWKSQDQVNDNLSSQLSCAGKALFPWTSWFMLPWY